MYASMMLAALALLHAPLAAAQSSCATPIAPSGNIKPSIASGYQYAVVATGLTAPRSILFDPAGNMLVLEQNKGLSKHVLKDDGGVCVSVASSTDILEDVTLTHGLAMNGSWIWVSSAETLYRMQYDPSNNKMAANSNTTIVRGMEGTDHTTRTLLIPEGMNSIIVSRGSSSNVDVEAENVDTGHSTVKIFNLDDVPSGGFVHNDSGTLLGWGLRNDVGVAIHPNTGGIWTVENSVDQLTRDGTDVHEDNPAEELNFLGYLNGSDSPTQGTNFGYPKCFTVWDLDSIPDNDGLSVGSAFSASSKNQSDCDNTTAPRLAFQAHMAPLDIKFNNSATEGWVTFHGSWDRTNPAGYGVGLTQWGDDGEPTEPSTSKTAVDFIFANMDNSKCPDDCFRPAGMAFDSKGRLFVASDASGEIYVIQRESSDNGTSGSNSTGGDGGSSGGGGSGSGADGRSAMGSWAAAVVSAICIFAVLI